MKLPTKNQYTARRLLVATAVGTLCFVALNASQAFAADSPFVLEKSIAIPNVPVGPYSDNVAVDAAGERIFATPQAAKSVAVIDAKGGHVLKMIPGVGNPHGLFHSSTLKRLFVVDGASGDVKVFSDEDYSLIKTIPLTVGADGLVYDPHSQTIYVSNGGEAAKMDHAVLTAIDPVKMEKITEIPIATDGLEGVVLDPAKQLAYVNLDEEDHAVAVVDLRKRQIVATWKFSGPHRSKGIALDAVHNRLFVACRDSGMHGSIVVLNTDNGETITTLPIGSWADGIFVDQKRQRIYITTGLGYIETYAIGPNGTYHRLESVETALLAKTSMYSNELERLYIDVPHIGSGSEDGARVLIFKPVP